MKSFLLFCLFCLMTLIALSQTPKDLSGKYISKKIYGDVWTLILNSDSTYIFASNRGESIPQGNWFIDRNNLVLSRNDEGKTYTYILKMNYQSNETKLKCKTGPVKRMKLNKVK